mmetsp:Transcript_10570/g.20345  ORF Transcript_10570/g.20345 Transcript_10570/m.20345 type:complete len:498 (-) Transcript_10570:282-1775(-)|eukprot:scaffold5198_cov173-Amphora_coffeaeformis.AAC.4
MMMMKKFRSRSLLLVLALANKGSGFTPLSNQKNHHHLIQRKLHLPQLRGATKETTDESKINDDDKSDAGASIPNLTISLVKSIVGGGVLAVPAGFAAMGGSPDIVPVAVTTVVCSGVLNAFYFRLMGKVCETTQAETYRQAWERTVGVESSPWVNAIVTLKTALSCLAFSIIIADSGQALAQAAGMVDITRTEALLGVTGIVLLPLTLQRDLSSLAPFSFVGVLGVLITTATIVIRYQDGSYLMETGTFAQDLPAQLQPHFVDSTSVAATVAPDALANSATAGAWGGWSGVVLSCTLATAYVAHYNAPRFFNELQNASVERFQKVTFASYTVAAILFVLVGCCGFLTFGQASQGYILNNYSPMDPLATFCKAALTGSILCTYPLPFVGLRDGCLDLLKVSNRDQVHEITTVALLAIITVGALLISDLGLVLSVGGGTFSTAVSAVFPVCMFLAMDSDNKSIIEQIAAGVGMLFSVSIGIAGVNIALAKSAAAAAAVS